ncbi:hypothetical protein HFO68_32910 [Rhizobium laguerreae]|uniref:O-antigen ligase family protein n=1 Tax=Rhizobium laguerreae TaxID=1076926 RepID=UPI001C90621E|nr:O-antigen ligase family protein [Rhizobium laguerreae]MBY3109292.1 hypothetical protein [Rhizobium laguerreae]
MNLELAIVAGVRRKTKAFGYQVIGPAFAAFASVLVFFNYLFFLKWFPITEGRWWVCLFIIAAFPFAIFFIRYILRARFSFGALILFCAVILVNFYVSRDESYNSTYFYGFLLLSVPFFVLGVVAGHWPKAIILVLFVAVGSFSIAILVAYFHYGGLWDALGFRDILYIPRKAGRPPFQTDYQLVAYGLAFGAIVAWAALSKKMPGWAHHLFGAVISIALTQIGSRGALLLFVLCYLLLLAKTQTIRMAISAGLLIIALMFVVAVEFPNSATFARAEYAQEFGVLVGKCKEEKETNCVGHPSLSWGRGTLYTYAVLGWFESPSTILFGHGFGSYSMNLADVYPNWIFKPADGSVYPHNIVLEAGYELGIIGVISLVAVIGPPLFRLILASWRQATGFETAVAILYIMACGLAMISGAIAYEYQLYFLLGTASVSGIPQARFRKPNGAPEEETILQSPNHLIARPIGSEPRRTSEPSSRTLST